jgi:hypothetical protein
VRHAGAGTGALCRSELRACIVNVDALADDLQIEAEPIPLEPDDL